jgi:nitrate/nitrite transport system substrate-binding protein
LVAEGKAKASDFPADSETGIKPPQAGFIDGIVYDASKPNDYLAKFAIGLKGKQTVSGGQVVD